MNDILDKINKRNSVSLSSTNPAKTFRKKKKVAKPIPKCPCGCTKHRKVEAPFPHKLRIECFECKRFLKWG